MNFLIAICRAAVFSSLLVALPLQGYQDLDRDGSPIISNEADITLRMEVEQALVIHACEARVELEYYQKGPNAHVETHLSNGTCGASSGTYTIVVRYRDAEGEFQSMEFEENWKRTDDSPVVAVRDYFVADDVDILRVRSRELRCVCADDSAGTEPALDEE
jgi:hypothetical protein